MQASEKAINLIKQFEGLREQAYFCPAGKLTIGYGHVLQDDETFRLITQEWADKLLKDDVAKIEKPLQKLLEPILQKMTQGQYDALVSLVYNTGVGALANSKQALPALLKRDFKEADKQLFSADYGFVKIGKKFSKGLYNRRQAERALYYA